MCLISRWRLQGPEMWTVPLLSLLCDSTCPSTHPGTAHIWIYVMWIKQRGYMAQNKYVSKHKKHVHRQARWTAHNPTLPTVDKAKAASHLEPDELLNVVREVRGEVCQQLAQPRLLVEDRQETQLGTVRPCIEKLFNNYIFDLDIYTSTEMICT